MDIPSYLIGAIAGANKAGVKYIVVQELPTTGEEGTIYLVPKTTSKTNNVYNEYMYINNNWELIGDTQADISGKEDTSNKVTSINNQSTDTQYPSAKCVYDNLGGKQDAIQYSTMPTASSSTVGKIVQYIGTTTNDYTNGYFYIGATDGESTPTYSWTQLDVQPSSGGKYVINCTYTGSYNLTNYNTADNKNVFQQIYDNYNNIKTSDILIDVEYYGKYNIDNVFEYTIDSNTKKITLTLSILRNNVMESNYGVSYRSYKLFEVYVLFKNDVVYGDIYSDYYDKWFLDGYNAILGINNTTSYTPSNDYQPATKKYVDDAIGTALSSSY